MFYILYVTIITLFKKTTHHEETALFRKELLISSSHSMGFGVSTMNLSKTKLSENVSFGFA